MRCIESVEVEYW